MKKSLNASTLQTKYVYGLSGLAMLIGCSKPTAHRIKDSGIIPYAKFGKKFIFNKEEVIAALSYNRKELGNG